MRPLRYSINVTLDGCVDHREGVPDEELLGDRVRAALGRDARVVEQVEVVSTTPVDDLPAAARERLGARPGQHNVLLRVTVRALDRTLTAAEGNDVRDRIAELAREHDEL